LSHSEETLSLYGVFTALNYTDLYKIYPQKEPRNPKRQQSLNPETLASQTSSDNNPEIHKSSIRRITINRGTNLSSISLANTKQRTQIFKMNTKNTKNTLERKRSLKTEKKTLTESNESAAFSLIIASYI
jgi:hypothetical protein